MASKCSDYSVKGCPASYYLKCRAYAEGLNCWDLQTVPCCSRTNLTECRDCETYKKGKSEQEQCEASRTGQPKDDGDSPRF